MLTDIILSAKQLGPIEAARLRVEAEIRKERNVSVIALVDALIAYACVSGASDLHFNPGREILSVRLRIDGLLDAPLTLPAAFHDALIARFKILAGLRTDEHYAPQDGRFRLDFEGDAWVDVRISIVPTHYGENAVLRLLNSTQEERALSTLGLSQAQEALVTQALNRIHGMILVTGPTGSGKTTTLYALMRLLTSRPLSLVTIEDPVEYSIPNVNQIAANAQTGLTFARGLRSILRQDPDVIMVGEIRDAETAGLAVHAALTGHLVLSTLHTNDAPTTLPRLMDLGVEPYLIASTISLITAQRLVRRICGGCRTPKRLSPAEYDQLLHLFGEHEEVSQTFFVGVGCKACGGSGYRGRVGLYEFFHIDTAIEKALARKAGVRELQEIARAGGMIPLVSDGLSKTAEGQTTVEELLRICHE